MKTLALVTSAALLLAGVSVASAQSTTNEKPAVPPSSINKGSDQPNARTSGSEPKAAAQTTAPGKKKMKKAKKHTSKKKSKVATSPADINKGSNQPGARTSGSQPKSMAK